MIDYSDYENDIEPNDFIEEEGTCISDFDGLSTTFISDHNFILSEHDL